MIEIATCANWERGDGIGNYASELTRHLEDTSISLTRINYKSVQIPVFGPYIEQYFYLGKKIQKIDEEFDIIHLPSQTQAASLCYYKPNTPVVVTVHDIIPLVSKYDSLPNQAFARVFTRGLKSADRIITISRHTKFDLVNSLGIQEKSIDVVYPSIDHTAYADPAPKSSLRDMGIEPPFILFVGTQGSKKNLEVIYEALNNLPDELDFVVVGTPGNPIQGYWNKYMIRKYGVSEQIIHTGFVSNSVLSRLYRSALAFVFPSKYEGFVRPPLEAMSNGCPVIASNSTAIPEVLGEAPLYCDPDEPKQWAKQIEKLHNDESLREELIEKGRNRVSEFSWEKTA
ncbi:MAG: glycosyltransferase family 4 protein, partial [Halobacteriaceae archaeon]